MSDDRCTWCNTSTVEAALRHEGPHATWCVNFREAQRGGDDAVRAAFNRALMDGGRIISNGQTRAFLTGWREGWWTQGRGINNGDCVHSYAERHYPDYMEPSARKPAVGYNR